MKLRKILVLFLLIIVFGKVTTALGQEKFEREFNIQAAEAPAPARVFIDNCDFDRKIKWYKEESQEGISFEAKTKFSGNWFSIEFDTLGVVEDVEKKVSKRELDLPEIEKINIALSDKFSKFKITKIQKQWKASAKDLQSLIFTGSAQGAFDLAYEVVVRGKSEKHWHTYEVLINPCGEVLKILKIVRRNTDNIEL
jgi:hypothetical protein